MSERNLDLLHRREDLRVRGFLNYLILRRIREWKLDLPYRIEDLRVIIITADSGVGMACMKETIAEKEQRENEKRGNQERELKILKV